MALEKKLGTRKQAILFATLAVVLLLAVVRWRPGGASAPAGGSSFAPSAGPNAARPSAGAGGDPSGDEAGSAGRGRRAAVKPGKEVNPDDVPVLDVKDFAPHAAKGSADPGRDLFDLREPTRKPLPTATPAPPAPGDVRFVGPLPPPPPTPTPAPPAVGFKFLGTFGPKEHPIAVIQQGEQILNVRAGDTLFGKFILKKVGYESIDVGFVGFPEAETRRLGITP
jgi:hypothetical protein